MVGSICGGGGSFFSNCADVGNIVPLVDEFFKLLLSNCVGDVGFDGFFVNNGMLNMIATIFYGISFNATQCIFYFFFCFGFRNKIVFTLSQIGAHCSNVCRTSRFTAVRIANCVISAVSLLRTVSESKWTRHTLTVTGNLYGFIDTQTDSRLISEREHRNMNFTRASFCCCIRKFTVVRWPRIRSNFR